MESNVVKEGVVYLVEVEFSDKTIRWVDKKEIKNNSSALLKLYFDKINQHNPEINHDGLQLTFLKGYYHICVYYI